MPLGKVFSAVLAVAAIICLCTSVDVEAQEGPSAQPRETVRANPECGPFLNERFNTNEVDLAFTEGPRNGPTIIFLPGMGVPRQSYQNAANLLCSDFHVIVLDQRGQGESEWSPDGSYTVGDYGRDLLSFIDGELEGAPVIISGHSLGALVALWLASEHPHLVRGLNLEDGPFLISERGRWETHWAKPIFEAFERRLRAYNASGREPNVLREAFADEPFLMPRQDVPYLQRVQALGKFLANLEARGALDLNASDRSRMEAAGRLWLEGRQVTNADLLPASILDRAPMVSASMDPAVAQAAANGTLNDGFSHEMAFASVSVPTLYWNSDPDLVGVLAQSEHSQIIDRIGSRVRAKGIVATNVGHLIHSEVPDWYASEIARFFGAQTR